VGRLAPSNFPVQSSDLADRVKLAEHPADFIGIETMDAYIPPTVSGAGG
jgi:hypothetical protein